MDYNYEKTSIEPHIDQNLNAIKEKTKVNLYDTTSYQGINDIDLIYGINRIMEKKKIRKYTAEDPYGEEEWEE